MTMKKLIKIAGMVGLAMAFYSCVPDLVTKTTLISLPGKISRGK